MLKPIVRNAVIVGAFAALTGCAIVPGTHLTYKSQDVVAEPESELPTELPVAVYPITPYLVEQHKQQPEAVAQAENAALTGAIAAYEYRVGAGDVLNVQVADHPEVAPIALEAPAGINQEKNGLGSASGVKVQRDGSIFVAYAGQVQVAGKTIPEVRQLLTKSLGRYIKSPQVSVAVHEFHAQKVYVTGDLEKTAVLPVTTEPMTLLDAVAGMGLAPTPDMESVVLVRGAERTSHSLRRLLTFGDASENVLLQGGDVLNFSRNTDRGVFLLGEVGMGRNSTAGKGAGKLLIGASGLSLAEALAQVGGVNELTANPTGVFVMRGKRSEAGQASIDIFQLDASNATAYILADQFQLQPRDFVYVTAAPIVRFNRVISQLMPMVSNYLIYESIKN